MGTTRSQRQRSPPSDDAAGQAAPRSKTARADEEPQDPSVDDETPETSDPPRTAEVPSSQDLSAMIFEELTALMDKENTKAKCKRMI